jgi:hypothetical protein
MKINLAEIRKNRSRDGFIPALIGASLIGSGSSLIGGVLQGKANKKAAKRQAANEKAARELQLKLYKESRGADGSAVLPLFFAQGLSDDEWEFMSPAAKSMYADIYNVDASNLDDVGLRDIIKQASGLPFEQQLARRQQMNILSAMDPAQMQVAMEQATQTLAPAQQASNQYIQDIFSGALTQQELDNFQPVADARTESVEAEKQAAMDMLRAQQAQIAANRQTQGLGGDSFAQQLLQLRAGQDASRKSAGAQGLARVQNAIDKMNIKNQGIQRTGRNLNAPAQQIANNVGFLTGPQTSYAQAQSQMQQPLNFFNIGTGTPPGITPISNGGNNSTAAQIFSGVGQAANQFAQINALTGIRDSLKASTQPVQGPANDPFNSIVSSGNITNVPAYLLN